MWCILYQVPLFENTIDLLLIMYIFTSIFHLAGFRRIRSTYTGLDQNIQSTLSPLQ